jgi:hypothetical protein
MAPSLRRYAQMVVSDTPAVQAAEGPARPRQVGSQHKFSCEMAARSTSGSYEDIERVATRFSGFFCIFGCRGTASQFDSKAATVPRVCQAGGTLAGKRARRIQ